MGRLPLHRLPRRRRGRARQPQREAADPVLPGGRRGGPRRSCRSAASSTARSSSPPARGWTSRRCCSASTRPTRGCGCSPSRRPRPSSPSTCWPSATSRCSSARRPSAGRCWRRRWRAAAPPVHLTPVTRDPARGAGVVHRLRGRRARRRDGQAAAAARTSRTSGRCSRSSTPGRPTASSRATGWHKSGPVVGSLVLGLYDDAGQLQHVGVAASFTMARRAELVEELAPYVAEDSEAHPWRGEDAAERNPQSSAGSRWNTGKDLSFVAAATGARRRGRLRPHGGQPLPAHRAVPAAGDRTATRRPARTPSSTVPSASTSVRCSAREAAAEAGRHRRRGVGRRRGRPGRRRARRRRELRRRRAAVRAGQPRREAGAEGAGASPSSCSRSGCS